MTLEERITRLEDMEAIKKLKFKYAQILDEGYNPEQAAALFTPDGLWSITGVGGTAKGREAIKKHSANLGASIIWGQHNMFAPDITINADGKSATGKFYLICLLTMYDAEKKPEAYILAGKYQDKFVKVNGEWYFKELVGEIDQAAPWSDGWVSNPIKKESW